MEIILISLEEIKILKKKRKGLLVFFFGTFLVLAVFGLFAYLFQNRSTQMIWIVCGTFLTSLWLIVIAYVFLKMLSPLQHYLKFSKTALSGSRQINSVRVDSLGAENETFDGFKTKFLEGKEVDKLTLMHYRYEASADLKLKAGRIYEIEAFDGVVLRVKEKT
jgi:hypothetical protein